MKPSGNLSHSKPLQRTTPLVRHTPLSPGKGLARSPWPRHQPPIPRTPAGEPPKARKRPSRTGESRARKLVYARSGGRCEVQIPGICLGPGMNWHHILDRKHGGPWAVWNGLHVCGSGSPGHGCHGTLTTPPPGRAAEFERNGWIAPSTGNPRGAAVSIPRGAAHPGIEDDGRVWVLLTEDGKYEEVGEQR